MKILNLNQFKENNIFNGNLNDYPDISTLKNLGNLDRFNLPIMISYSLNKSNIVGIKIGMSALVKFDPKTLTSHVKLILNNNNDVILLEKLNLQLFKEVFN